MVNINMLEKKAEYKGEIYNSKNEIVGYWDNGYCKMISENEIIEGNYYEK